MTSAVADLSLGNDLVVRLVDPPSWAVRDVRAQLGGVPGSAGGAPPLLTIRFATRIEHGPLQVLGLSGNAFAFDTRHFFLVEPNHSLVRLDLADLPEAEILVERRAGSIPLLLPLLGLALLARDRVLLHASTFRLGRRVVVATGWQSGGKSELLLAFQPAGAAYASDEWTIVGADGSVIGLCSNVHLWDWQLRQRRQLERRIPRAERRRLAALRLVRSATRAARRLPDGSVGRSLRQLDGWVANALRVSVEPASVFERVVGHETLAPDVVLLGTVSSGRAAVQPIGHETLAARMTASLAYERSALLRAWTQYAYAFPAARNPLLEEASSRERCLLEAAFRGVPAFEVAHAYPPSLDDLRDLAVPAVTGVG